MKQGFFQIKFEVEKDITQTKSYENNKEIKGTIISGYASTADVDRYDDIIEPNAFLKSIKENYKDNPIILFQHKHDEPIGIATFMSVTNKGLYIEALIVDERIEPKIQAEILKAFSVGFIPLNMYFKDKDGNILDLSSEIDYNKLWEQGTKRVISELDLAEISIVSVPANPNALFSSEKSVKRYIQDNLEEIKNLNLKNMKVKNLLNEAEVKEVEAITDSEIVEETPVIDTPKEEIQEATETIDTPVAEEAKEEIVDEISNEAEGTETIPAPAEEAQGLNVDVVAELTSLKALVESVKMENEALKKK